MNKNIVIILLFIGLGIISYLWYDSDNFYKEQLKAIEKERESLKMAEAVLEYQKDSLKKLEPKILWRTKNTENKLKNKQNETDAIYGIVATYSDRKLDSILSNHRFKPRNKSRDSINH
jgi:hypothetical protein